MKNTLRVLHDKQQIVMDRTFDKMSQNPRSEEYVLLQSVRRDYPTYKVIRHTIKKNPNQEHYKGLTYTYMENYIVTHDPDSLDEYMEMRLISECHSKAFRYPTIKKWFLAKYPEVATFNGILSTDETDPSQFGSTNVTPFQDPQNELSEDANGNAA